MTFDSIKKYMRGLYTFFKKKMSASNILGLCLTVLFVGLSIDVKAVDLPARINTTCDWGGTSVNLTKDKDGCYHVSGKDRMNNCEWWVENNDGAIITVILNFDIKDYDENNYSNTPDSNGHNPPFKTNSDISVYVYYYNSQWIATENQSEAESLAQDPNGGSGCDKPTINTTSIQNVSAGTTLSQISISV